MATENTTPMFFLNGHMSVRLPFGCHGFPLCTCDNATHLTCTDLALGSSLLPWKAASMRRVIWSCVQTKISLYPLKPCPSPCQKCPTIFYLSFSTHLQTTNNVACFLTDLKMSRRHFWGLRKSLPSPLPIKTNPGLPYTPNILIKPPTTERHPAVKVGSPTDLPLSHDLQPWPLTRKWNSACFSFISAGIARWKRESVFSARVFSLWCTCIPTWTDANVSQHNLVATARTSPRTSTSCGFNQGAVIRSNNNGFQLH